MFLFKDRLDAGKQLANLIEAAIKVGSGDHLPVVYGLPRGGVPIAKAIASQLQCPLSVLVSKKISLPHNPELALGAVTADGETVWSSYINHIPQAELDQAQEQAYEKARQQWALFAPFCQKINCQGAIAILADDGIATGMTMMAAAMSLKKYRPQEIWLTAPVAPPQIVRELQQWGDRVIIVNTPDPFFNVGRFYLDFPQVPTQEALKLIVDKSVDGEQ
jgi:predicted phosphoribosyltransferase